MSTTEVRAHIEAVRVSNVRDTFGPLTDLGLSIKEDGLRQPITLWSDGTLISGARRLRAHFLLSGSSGGHKFKQIPAVFVDTIEDAAQRLLADSRDEHLALPMKWSEIVRLWEVIRRLDEPAALKRADAARRRGVELRRATMAGHRRPGRSTYSEDYVLQVLAEPFGISAATADRIRVVWQLSRSAIIDPARREAAIAAMKALDEGEKTPWAAYRDLTAGHPAPTAAPKPKAAVEPKPAIRQLAAWERALPEMEGLTAGLVDLGPPNPDLTWSQVGPVHARLMVVRRDLEKIIKQMKEINK